MTDIAGLVAGGDTPLIAVVGPVGAGQDALVERLRATLDRAPHVRCSPHPLGASLLSSITMAGAVRWTHAGPLTGAVAPPERTAAAIVSALRRADIRVLLIEDAHWLDADSLAVLESLVRAGVTCVCTAELPGSPVARDTLRQLWSEGLAQVLTLRPLGPAAIATATHQALQARPEPELVAALGRLSGGLPAVLSKALTSVVHSDGVAFAAGRAHLIAPVSAVLPADHPVIAAIRRGGPEEWPIVKAIAALHPIGAGLPTLVTAILGAAPDAVMAVIGRLCRSGVLRRSRHGWRFRSEAVAATIAGQVGPFERRLLAGAAVTAVWDGGAEHVDPTYYADRLAEAGKLVDRETACEELLACADRLDGPGSERWLLAAATVTADDQRRLRILIRHAQACYRHRSYEECLRSAERVLHEHGDSLSDAEIDVLTQLTVLARRVVGKGKPSAPADVARHALSRATDLLLDGHPDHARLLLTAHEGDWRVRPSTARLGHLVLAQAHLLLGRQDRFEHALDAAGSHWEVAHLRLLPALLDADAEAVEKILACTGIAVERLAPAHRAAITLLRGDFRLGENLARALGNGSDDIAATVVQERIATLAFARGQLTLSRDLITGSRNVGAALPYLLDSAEAKIDQALGDHEQARTRLRQGLARAADRSTVLGTDRLWAQLAELQLRRGDIDGARRCCREAERVSDSPGVRLRAQVVRAIVERDADLASIAIGLATDRRQPLEFATTVGRLVSHGLADPRILKQAYEFVEELDALLCRSWLRGLMRDHGVVVPGRRQTLAENERLLAVLAADGLTNKQLATVLQASEKSVEGRLSRLFTRSGYQSRVELAAAVHAGEYPL